MGPDQVGPETGSTRNRSRDRGSGSDLFETESERRVRKYWNLAVRGYSHERACELSGVTPEDFLAVTPPPTPRKDDPSS